MSERKRREMSDLPDWLRKRGHPLPEHRYEIDEYMGYIYMTCPKSQGRTFRLWFENCNCEDDKR